MKTYSQTKSIYLFLAALLFIISGCDTNNPEDGAPDVIPSEVFTLPVDLFNQPAAPKAPPGVNFTAAALRVWPVSLIISANLIIPSITTAHALQTEPVFENGMWVWSSTVNNGSQSVQFNLSAERIDGSTNWSMTITTTDPLTGAEMTNFELFRATTTDNGASGSWQLFYASGETAENILNASYTITSETEKSITFSIPQTAQQGAGDSVMYDETGELRTFTWEQIAETMTHTVTWNMLTQDGSITATNFNGGTMGCWDENLEDVACTPAGI